MPIFIEGHGTYKTEDGTFVVPDRVTIKFYIPHESELSATAGRYSPTTEECISQSLCYNYKIWPLYGLQLHHKDTECKRYGIDELPDTIPTGDLAIINAFKNTGIRLSCIVDKLRSKYTNQDIEIRWLACREKVAPESTVVFSISTQSFDPPEYSNTIQKIVEMQDYNGAEI